MGFEITQMLEGLKDRIACLIGREAENNRLPLLVMVS